MPTNKKPVDKKALRIATVVGIMFGLLTGIGYAADKSGELMVGRPLWWLCIMALAAVCTLLMYLLLTRAGKAGNACGKIEDDSSAELNINKVTIRKVIIFAAVLFVCWLPVFLAEYPGFFVYDATDEFVEVASRSFSTHHPLFHVLLLGGSVCAGNKVFGNYNAGIALYTLFQMLVVAGIFGWITAQDCGECKSRKSYRISMGLHLIWYGLFPTVVMFVLCSAKDTLFSAFMLISVVMIYKLAADYHKGNTICKKNIVVLAVSLVLMMLMRHNGVYAVLFLAICTLIYTSAETKRKDGGVGKGREIFLVMGFFAISVLTYKAVDAGLTGITGADTAESQEMLTVPIQQLARCWRPYQSQMSEEEKETILTYIPETALERYTPNLSDPVKADFNNKAFSEKQGGFIKIWLKMFAKHPLSYLNAWIDTSYGYYYPWTVVNVYRGHTVYTFTYDESSYFGYEVELPGERHSLIPVIDRFYRWLSLDDDIQKVPALHLLFSMGALFWAYTVIMALLIYKKNMAAFVSLMLPVGVWLTLLLGPTFLPRYTIFLWFILPVGIKYAVTTFKCKED